MLRTLLALSLALATSACVSPAELDQARLEDLRFSSRMLGFAVDANEQSLQTRLALLAAFEGDPRFELLTQALGTVAENEARLSSLRKAKLELIDAGQRRMAALGDAPQ